MLKKVVHILATELGPFSTTSSQMCAWIGTATARACERAVPSETIHMTPHTKANITNSKFSRNTCAALSTFTRSLA